MIERKLLNAIATYGYEATYYSDERDTKNWAEIMKLIDEYYESAYNKGYDAASWENGGHD